MSSAWHNQVDRFCRQYLQLEAQLDYPEDTVIRLPEVQDAIYTRVFADDAIRYGPPIRFRHNTLKELVSRVEASIEDFDQHEVSEDIMDALAVLLATPLPSELSAAQQKSYVTYSLSELAGVPNQKASAEPHITLLENRSLISAAGTTGLRTWEAALHLGQYICKHPDLIRSKRVLELGAGTGYLSILSARHLEAAHVLASDGSDDVINNLPENMFINDLQDSDLMIPMELRWGHALVGTEESAWNGGRPVDVVLGADVTYDDRVIPALVGTIVDLIALHPRVEVYISATQRNYATFGVFMEQCRENSLIAEDVDFEVPVRALQRGPFYNDEVSIRICKVYRNE